MVPAIETVMKHYSMIARLEQMKSGRPCARTVQNALAGTRHVCEAAGISLGMGVDRLTRRAIDNAIVAFIGRGISRTSAWSYVCQLRSLFARWCQPYYREAGWRIKPLELPHFSARAPRYVRPSPAMIARVKNWYKNTDGVLWFAATMMLEFAMRNGDVLRLTDGNFMHKDGQVYLCYTPHKTELSSGRRVCWPIHPDIWARISEMGGMEAIGLTDEVFEKVNRQMRKLGFEGAKGAYELRKMCIDHVYQRFGAEMATSISGDDIKTISHYYADPAQPNIGRIRILDLL